MIMPSAKSYNHLHFCQLNYDEAKEKTIKIYRNFMFIRVCLNRKSLKFTQKNKYKQGNYKIEKSHSNTK